MNRILRRALVAGVLLLGGVIGIAGSAVADDIPNRVYELTTFTAPDGRLSELKTRFRNHITRIMMINGMQVVGLWTPTDEARSANRLIVMVSHESQAAASVAWKDVEKEREWKKLVEASATGERLLIKIEKEYLSATDFSPMK